MFYAKKCASQPGRSGCATCSQDPLCVWVYAQVISAPRASESEFANAVAEREHRANVCSWCERERVAPLLREQDAPLLREGATLSPDERVHARFLPALFHKHTHSSESILTAIKVFQREFASANAAGFFPSILAFFFLREQLFDKPKHTCGRMECFPSAKHQEKSAMRFFFSVRARQR